MTWWQIILAVLIILVGAFMVFSGIFEYIAFRDQNEVKDKDMHQYNREHRDD